MESRSDSSGVAIVISLVLVVLLLLLLAGGGIYFVVARQRVALMMELERAQIAEQEARMQADRARIAELTAAASSAYDNNELPVDQDDPIRTAVESILRTQEEAWNQGDLEAFMEHYWKSETLTFSSAGKTTRGWTETLNRYKERYPGPEKMGRLKLSDLEITPLGNSAALVLGQWHVERDSEPLGGNFSLVVRKFDGRWLIVHDHTSRLSE